jgi:putative SOS response-associated peptidase YedK
VISSGYRLRHFENLEKPDFTRWLASEPSEEQKTACLLAPSPPVARPVISRVNSVRNEDDSLIEEINTANR